MEDFKLSVLVPVRNEGLNLKILIKILKVIIEVPYEVVVVYDNKEDDSIAVIRELQSSESNLVLVYNDLGCGVVNALKKGIAVCRGEIILIFAADEVGPLLAVNDMLELMRQGCDFVSCTRYAYGGRRLGGSFVGGILSRIANYFFQKLSGSVFTDSTTGIKMIRADILRSWNLKSAPVGWVVAFELAILAQLNGLKLGEVPIISVDRLYGGKSSFKLGPWVIEYSKWFIKGTLALHRSKKRCSYIMRPSTYFSKTS